MDHVMEMSLDEYIAFSNKCDHHAVNSNNESCFKEERQRNTNEEDDDGNEDAVLDFPTTSIASTKLVDEKQNGKFLDVLNVKNDIAEKCDAGSIKMQFDAEQQNNMKKNFDLREKIENNRKNIMISPLDSTRWVMLGSNNNANRFAEIPTLMSCNVQAPNPAQYRHNRNARKRRRNRRRKLNNFSNLHAQEIINQQSNNRTKILKIETDTIQQNIRNMNNMKITFDKINNSNNTPKTNKSNYIYLTSAAAATFDAIGSGQRVTDVSTSDGNDIQSLLGISGNVKSNNMSDLAGKFLDFLQNGTSQTVHKPIYDMKIQKEIHDLQNKQFQYSKPGGEIITSDGPGINNCKVTPNSSGISLNCRFI